MKKRIWNQLKKAVMITAAVGILGAGAVSAAEFEAAELYVPAVGLKQSAQWIDEEKFQAELTLEVMRSERTVQKSTGEYCFGERTVADGK